MTDLYPVSDSLLYIRVAVVGTAADLTWSPDLGNALDPVIFIDRATREGALSLLVLVCSLVYFMAVWKIDPEFWNINTLALLV